MIFRPYRQARSKLLTRLLVRYIEPSVLPKERLANCVVSPLVYSSFSSQPCLLCGSWLKEIE